jgi:ABC-2 type transport system ATP-binding protein
MLTAPDLIISTQDLTKAYGKRPVVNQLNLAIPKGSICGFLGSNGAGKSTTIKLLLGLTKPSSGSGTIFGKSIAQDGVAIRERVGLLAQSPSLYGYLTARETLQFVASFFFSGPKTAIAALGRRDVLQILESFRGRSTVFYSTHILDDV